MLLPRSSERKQNRFVLALLAVLAGFTVPCFGQTVPANRGQVASAPAGAQAKLPSDVYPDSRNRLPLIKREDLDERGKKAYDQALGKVDPAVGLQGEAEIRQHGGGENVRFESPLGRPLTELAILVNARESNQQYEWTLHEEEGLRQGLEAATIEIVRNREPPTGLPEKEAVVIELGREIVINRKVSSDTFARALKLLGASNLVDIVSLTGQYTVTSVALATVDQHLPVGWKLLLPVPDTSPADIYPETRSRLTPLKRATPAPQPTNTNNDANRRGLAPAGTGPGEILAHGAGGKFLEADLGRPLMELTILATARELDQQYEWTLHEKEALKQGLDAKTIDVVRNRRPLTGVDEKAAVIVEMVRQIFEKDLVDSDTYAHAVKLFGERDVVDLAGLIGQHSDAAALLTAFDQQLPAGQEPLLPVP